MGTDVIGAKVGMPVTGAAEVGASVGEKEIGDVGAAVGAKVEGTDVGKSADESCTKNSNNQNNNNYYYNSNHNNHSLILKIRIQSVCK